MNIAFPAFFILVLIIPGFIFQNAYEKVENPVSKKSHLMFLHLWLFFMP